MGIKGARKRERTRQEKKAREGIEEGGSSDGEEAPGMKNSELHLLRDLEYLEGEADGRTRKVRRVESAPAFAVSISDEAAMAAVGDAEDEIAGSFPHLPSGGKFSHPNLGLHPELVAALAKEGFDRMTIIQERTIPFILSHFDVLGQAKTGSGKTLAFGIPILQRGLAVLEQHPHQFISLILSPTKELCMQISSVLSDVAQHLTSVRCNVELITGGTKLPEERRRLRQTNIVVGTPGRVHDHLQHSGSDWQYQSISLLVLDEADRILASGFQKDVDRIIGLLPPSRQTLLFSATNTKSVRELARLALSKMPLFVDSVGDAPQLAASSGVGSSLDTSNVPVLQYTAFPDEDVEMEGKAEEAQKESAMPSQLKQFCQIVPPKDRLRALYAFVKRIVRRSLKAMIFCSTVASATFHCMMMGATGFHRDVLMLHGKMKHRQRLATLEEFCRWESGVLFCTDVAARGLDIPHVSWILQFDPPVDPTEYIHRVGRTARAGAAGSALIFLSPSEQGFVRYLARFGLTLSQYVVRKLPDIQEMLEHTLSVDPVVARAAQEAFRSFVGAYQSHLLRKTFDLKAVDLVDLAKGFALVHPPSVSIVDREARQKEHVVGKLRSLNRRRVQMLRHMEEEKTKQQWTETGQYVGLPFGMKRKNL